MTLQPAAEGTHCCDPGGRGLVLKREQPLPSRVGGVRSGPRRSVLPVGCIGDRPEAAHVGASNKEPGKGLLPSKVDWECPSSWHGSAPGQDSPLSLPWSAGEPGLCSPEERPAHPVPPVPRGWGSSEPLIFISSPGDLAGAPSPQGRSNRRGRIRPSMACPCTGAALQQAPRPAPGLTLCI